MLTDILTAATSSTTISMSVGNLVLCTMASLVFGMIGAGIYMFRNTYNKSFVVTLALLPAMVQVVIMLVNGNLGTGVAVMGAFSLVRFRSIPGSAREIGSIFFAMALGLATGMGYIGYAGIFLVMLGVVSLFLAAIPFGESRTEVKELKVTIPENLNYTGIFDDLFLKYTKSATLLQVRTTNMGSMFELKYRMELKEETLEKELLDEIRCRNGNLTICCGKVPMGHSEAL